MRGHLLKLEQEDKEGLNTEEATAGPTNEPWWAALAPWEVREKGDFGDRFRGSVQDKPSHCPLLPQLQGSWGAPEFRRCMSEEGGERGGRKGMGMLQGGGERPLRESFIIKAFKGGGLWGGSVFISFPGMSSQGRGFTVGWPRAGVIIQCSCSQG